MRRRRSWIAIGGRGIGGFVVEAAVAARRRKRWGTHREPNTREDRLRGLGRMNRRKDPHRAAATRALEDVDREDGESGPLLRNAG